MITALIIILLITLFIQPSESRFHIALVFVGGVLIHEIFYSHLEGLPYHASSALVSLGSIIVLSYLGPSLLIKRLIKILLLMIVFDATGYFLWYTYISPFYYNFAIGMLFGAAICLLTRGGKNDRKRDARVIKRGSYIFNNINSRFSYLFKGKKQA